MKYILLEHANGNDPKVLRIFDTPEARAQATRNAILGDPEGDIMAIECPELDTLAQCGIVHFEGDPSVEWIDAIVPATPAPVNVVTAADMDRMKARKNKPTPVVPLK